MSEQTPPDGDKSYPPMIATNAILQYLREIFMALDNISFQIRTTMNNIIETKKEDVDTFEVKNPNNTTYQESNRNGHYYVGVIKRLKNR